MTATRSPLRARAREARSQAGRPARSSRGTSSHARGRARRCGLAGAEPATPASRPRSGASSSILLTVSRHPASASCSVTAAPRSCSTIRASARSGAPAAMASTMASCWRQIPAGASRGAAPRPSPGEGTASAARPCGRGEGFRNCRRSACGAPCRAAPALQRQPRRPLPRRRRGWLRPLPGSQARDRPAPAPPRAVRQARRARRGCRSDDASDRDREV
jgi:hypothetical protein